MPSARSSSSSGRVDRDRVRRRPARARAPRATRRAPRRRRGRAVRTSRRRARGRSRRRSSSARVTAAPSTAASASFTSGTCLPTFGPRVRKFGTHRVVEQTLEVGDRLELLHVERVGDLGRDRVGERAAVGQQHQRAPQRLAHLQLGLVARRQAERHDRARPLHLGLERVVARGGVDRGPVGEVHRLARRRRGCGAARRR